MLDVQRAVDVDAQIQKFLNVLPSFQMPGTGDISVGQFIHQEQSWFSLQGRVNIKLFEDGSAVIAFQRRGDFQTLQQGGRFFSPVGFQEAHHHVDAFGFFHPGRFQHGVGFSNPGRGAEENLQLAPFGLGRFHLDPGKKLIRIGAFVVH